VAVSAALGALKVARGVDATRSEDYGA
jgi:hypothetical protein